MKALLMTVVLVAVLCLSLVSSAQSATPEEPSQQSAYSIYYSPPERLDALFAAFMDAIPYGSFESYQIQHLLVNTREFWGKALPKPSFEALVAMEDRFGDMPEYWQLMYVYGTTGDEKDIKYLEKACEVAPDDPVSQYYFAYYGLYSGQKESSDDYSVEATLGHYDITARAAEGLLKAAEMDGQNAFYYYQAALGAMQDSGCEEAIALLKQGNEQPVNVLIELFPYSYIVEHRDLLPQLYPKKYLLLTALENEDMVLMLVKTKDLYKQLVVGVNLSGDLDWLTTVYRSACRISMQDNGSSITFLSGLVMITVLTNGATELGYGASDAEERDALDLAIKEKTRISDAYTSALKDFMDKQQNRFGYDGYNDVILVLGIPIPFVIGDTNFKEYLKASWDYKTEWLREGMPAAKAQIQGLLTFDFNNPSMFIRQYELSFTAAQ
jgi:hypothetical protein